MYSDLRYQGIPTQYESHYSSEYVYPEEEYQEDVGDLSNGTVPTLSPITVRHRGVQRTFVPTSHETPLNQIRDYRFSGLPAEYEQAEAYHDDRLSRLARPTPAISSPRPRQISTSNVIQRNTSTVTCSTLGRDREESLVDPHMWNSKKTHISVQNSLSHGQRPSFHSKLSCSTSGRDREESLVDPWMRSAQKQGHRNRASNSTKASLGLNAYSFETHTSNNLDYDRISTYPHSVSENPRDSVFSASSSYTTTSYNSLRENLNEYSLFDSTHDLPPVDPHPTSLDSRYTWRDRPRPKLTGLNAPSIYVQGEGDSIGSLTPTQTIYDGRYTSIASTSSKATIRPSRYL